MKTSNGGYKISSLSNMVQLKLVESSHTSFHKSKHECLTLNPLTSISNIP